MAQPILHETINVTQVTPRIGANVEGVTLAKPLSNRQVEELHQALAEHQVLFFRDQPLDVEGHKRFGRYFGELHIHPSTPGPEGHPEILPIHADANSRRINGEYWHSDVSCDEEPPMGSILYLHTVPDCGGDTLFASQYAAYDALSPRMKVYLEGLTATHSGDHVYRRNNALMGVAESGKVYPRASHPVVRTHPVTKRKALYVNGDFTTHIDGLLSVRVQHAGRIPGAVPLATPLGRLLGQPLRPASGAVGLLPADALRPPRDDQRRSAVLMSWRAYGGSGTPCERPRFCISKMFILKPLPIIMSPGFWSAVQGPSHLAAIVMVILPPGRASLSEVTVIV